MQGETYEEFVEKFKPKKQQMIAIHRRIFTMLCNAGR